MLFDRVQRVGSRVVGEVISWPRDAPLKQEVAPRHQSTKVGIESN